MSPRPWEQDSSTKKKEMVSYKILGLGREMKSKRRRTAAEDAGLYRYIGKSQEELARARSLYQNLKMLEELGEVEEMAALVYSGQQDNETLKLRMFV